MTLPGDFQFSQGSLQDLVDCKRRFQLRYLLQIAWPAVPAEPYLENEQHLRLGALFHLMAQQHTLGVDEARLTAMASEEPLAGWWQNFMQQRPALEGTLFPEAVLTTPFGQSGQRRLLAKMDLVAVSDGRATIYDWKTSRHRPPRTWLADRLQTRVYPYLLVQAGAELNSGQPFTPEQVEMVYWFAGFPDRPERFIYDAQRYAEDGTYLTGLLDQAATLSMSDEPFPLTPDESKCRFCVYRSLCNRGTAAGDVNELDFDDPEPMVEFDLDFEQVAEVDY